MSQSAAGLQKQIDALQKFCADMQLTVNVKKTKIMIFEQTATQCQPFMYCQEEIERVSSFKYLGVEFSATRGLCMAAEQLAAAGHKAVFALRRRCAALNIVDLQRT